MFCKKCGKEIAEDSTFCQFCGEKQEIENVKTEEKAEQTQKQNENASKMPTGCLIMIIIVFALVLKIAFTPEKPIEEDEIAQKSLARVLCQQEVQKSLKNPKSAEFASGSETGIKKVENMKYEILSYVYAQNGFGATIKNNYYCYVELEDKESGTIKKLTFN